MDFLDNLLYSLRSFARDARFSVMSVLLMTFGLGLFIFMMSFIRNTLEGPLPFDKGDKVYFLQTKLKNANSDSRTWYADYLDIAKVNTSFDRIGFYSGQYQQIAGTDRSFSEMVFSVETGFFELTGVKPKLGRYIDEQDLQSGAESVVVIAESLWMDLFAKDPEIVGQTMVIAGVSRTVIGVMPREFRFPDNGRVWVPFDKPVYGARNDSPKGLVYARLKEGVTLDKANKEVAQIMSDLSREEPDELDGRSANLVTYQSHYSYFDSYTALSIKIVVSLLLILTCLNTGNLLLSRFMGKVRDVAVRVAIGASRKDIIHLLLIDSFILSFVSCVLALGLASVLMKLSFSILVTNITFVPYWWQLELSTYNIIQGVLVGFISVFLCSVFPMWKSFKLNISDNLKTGTRGAQDKASSRISQVLVGIELLATSAVLITTASIVVAMLNKSQIDIGASIDNRLSALLSLPDSRTDTDERMLGYYQAIEQRMESQSDVEDVTLARWLPVSGAFERDVEIEGVDYGVKPVYPYVDINFVNHDYFKHFDINLVQGRLFDVNDKLDSPKVVVVTEQFVESHFPNENPLGKRFKIDQQGDDWYSIVGIVPNVVMGGLVKRNIERASIFLSLNQQPIMYPAGDIWISVKTVNQPEKFKPTFEKVLFELDSGIQSLFTMSLQDRKNRMTREHKFIMSLFIMFSVLALSLSVTGCYGVISNTIIQKRQEIGTRRALGADKLSLVMHFLGKLSTPVIVGLAIGSVVGVTLLQDLAKSNLAIISTIVISLILVSLALITVLSLLEPLLKALRQAPIYSLRDE